MIEKGGAAGKSFDGLERVVDSRAVPLMVVASAVLLDLSNQARRHGHCGFVSRQATGAGESGNDACGLPLND